MREMMNIGKDVNVLITSAASDLTNKRIFKIISLMKYKIRLGDEHDFKAENYIGWAAFEQDLEDKYNLAYKTPIYLIESNGKLSLKMKKIVGSMQIGYLIVTKEDVLDYFGGGYRVTQVKLKKINEAIVSELTKYNKQLNRKYQESKELSA